MPFSSNGSSKSNSSLGIKLFVFVRRGFGVLVRMFARSCVMHAFDVVDKFHVSLHIFAPSRDVILRVILASPDFLNFLYNPSCTAPVNSLATGSSFPSKIALSAAQEWPGQILVRGLQAPCRRSFAGAMNSTSVSKKYMSASRALRC